MKPAVMCRVPAFCDEVSAKSGLPVQSRLDGPVKVVTFDGRDHRFTVTEYERIRGQLPGRVFLEQI